MAKVSGDDDSWRASGLRKKYEDWESEHAPKLKKKKKKTKKWCRGKVGKEHEFEVVASSRYNYGGGPPLYLVDRCKKCKKEMNFRRNPELPMPRWWLGK